jgi:hypothetical protein
MPPDSLRDLQMHFDVASLCKLSRLGEKGFPRGRRMYR